MDSLEETLTEGGKQSMCAILGTIGTIAYAVAAVANAVASVSDCFIDEWRQGRSMKRYMNTGKEEAMPNLNQRHGPIVKCGPNAGKVRSRNKDGRWRVKRSDAGKPRG
jgi:hypothetical protein